MAFRYPISAVLGVVILLPLFVVGLLYIVIVGFIQRSYANAVWEGGFALLVAYFIPPLALSCATIDIDDDGISSSIFGIRLQQFNWDEILRIKKVKYTVNRYNPDEFIQIIKTEPLGYNFAYNALGIIRINNLILSYESLKNRINENAQIHHIDMCFVDENLARKQSSPKTRAAWIRDGVRVNSI